MDTNKVIDLILMTVVSVCILYFERVSEVQLFEMRFESRNIFGTHADRSHASICLAPAQKAGGDQVAFLPDHVCKRGNAARPC